MTEHVADDGLIARESGPWAEDKLYYLKRYFFAFNQATKATFTRRPYVDLLAGSGICFLKDYPSVRFPGSALLAAACEVPFTDMVGVEIEPESANALEKRLNGISSAYKPQILCGDCNDQSVIEEIKKTLRGEDTLSLIFVDTLGFSDVAFSTLEQLTRNFRADLIYTFQVNDAIRNIERAASDAGEAERFTRAFGTNEWLKAWRDHQRRQTPTSAFGDTITSLFERRLRQGLGYPHVVSHYRVMKNSKNAPLYRLILASHAELGPHLLQQVSAIESTGQRGLAF